MKKKNGLTTLTINYEKSFSFKKKERREKSKINNKY